MQWLKSTKTASHWVSSIFSIHLTSFAVESLFVAQNNHKRPLIGSFYLSVVEMQDVETHVENYIFAAEGCRKCCWVWLNLYYTYSHKRETV